MPASRPLNVRAFVGLTLLISGLGLPLSGLINHQLGFDPLSVERHAWMSAHNLLGLVFTVFSAWHAVLNRRSLTAYLRAALRRTPLLGREMLFALLVVGVGLFLVVGHALVTGDAAATRWMPE